MVDLPEPLNSRIQQCGWIPIELVGQGGGAKVYLCSKAEQVKVIQELMGARGAVSRPAADLKEAGDILKCLSNGLVRRKDALAALKVPHAENSVPFQRLKREVEAMRAIQHPSLIRLFGADEQDPPEWFVMEWHPNGTLSQSIDQYKGNLVKSLRAMLPIIEAVADLHDKGFIHRDIKPSNIFISDQGHLVLGDLGIVFPTEERERLTEPSVSLVSRDWIPDWARFTESPPQPKIDVFMLAKVLYFLVTGGGKVLATQIDDEEFDLTKRLKNVEGAAELQEVLLNSITTKEALCRFGDARELLSRLQDVLNQLAGNLQSCLLFSFLSVHSTTHIPIRPSYEQNPRYSSLRRLKIFLPNQCKKSLRVRIRLTEISVTATFFLFLQVDNRHITPPDSLPLNVEKPYGAEEVWSSEILINLTSPLDRGWHDLDITLASEKGGLVTGFMLYGE